MPELTLYDHDRCSPGKRFQWIFPVIECPAMQNLRDIVSTFGQIDITFTLMLGDFVASLLMSEWAEFWHEEYGSHWYPEERITGFLLDELSSAMYNHVMHEVAPSASSDDIDMRIDCYIEALHSELDTIHNKLIDKYTPYVRRYLEGPDAMTVNRVTGIDIIGDSLFVLGELI